MTMKVCGKCKETKSFDMFSKCKSRNDGLQPYCKACVNAYSMTYREANKERLAERGKIYSEANKEKRAEYKKAYRKDNKEKILEYKARRRAMKRNAIPKFLLNCELEKQRIRDTFKLRDLFTKVIGIQHDVDHMWPLSKGGPHWSGNLQILTATENLNKNSKLCKTLKKNIKASLEIARKEYDDEDHSNGHRD